MSNIKLLTQELVNDLKRKILEDKGNIRKI